MKRKHVLLTATFLGLISVVSTANAASCEEYPYSVGMPPPQPVQGGVKIVSTASASVSFDDISAINAARDEATLEAKAKIVHLLEEAISSETTSSKAVNDTSTLQGNTKDATLKTVREYMQKTGTSAKALMRGIVPLGDCYTKGYEVRVTVGIKPETIDNAGILSDSVRKSLSASPTPNSSNTAPSASSGTSASGPSPRTSGGMQGHDGFNNTTNLQNF